MVCGPSLLVERERVHPLDQNPTADALEVIEPKTGIDPGDTKSANDDGATDKVPTLQGVAGGYAMTRKSLAIPLSLVVRSCL